MEDEIYPLHLLSEELKVHQRENRLESIRRLRTIAITLGPERTRNDLIPLINEAAKDEDEVLVALADELRYFIPLIGGIEYISLLFQPLESLLGIEETLVRQKALETMQILMESIPDLTNIIIPLIERLIQGEWFTFRVSACSLFHISYNKIKAPEKRKELIELFCQKLCADDTPMVRRNVAQNLGLFAQSLTLPAEKPYLLTYFMESFRNLINDDQSTVKLLTLECSLPLLSQLLSPEENEEWMLGIIQQSYENQHWRIRYGIGKSFYLISKNFSESIIKTHLHTIFVSLLQDAETEVRQITSKNISHYFKLIEKSLFIKDVLPLLGLLSQDLNAQVRQNIALNSMELVPFLDEITIRESVLPLLLSFLRDEAVDARLIIVNNLQFLIPMLRVVTDLDLLNTLLDLFKEPQWRIRQAFLYQLPCLAEHLGQEYFEQYLFTIYKNALIDPINQVRCTASEIIGKMLLVLGNSYVLEKIFPYLREIYDTSIIYQERVNIIYACQELVTEKTSKEIIQEIMALCMKSIKDKIPNVKICTIKVVLHLMSKKTEEINATIISQIKPALTELQSDIDTDVKYFAAQAIESMAS